MRVLCRCYSSFEGFAMMRATVGLLGSLLPAHNSCAQRTEHQRGISLKRSFAELWNVARIHLDCCQMMTLQTRVAVVAQARATSSRMTLSAHGSLYAVFDFLLYSIWNSIASMLKQAVGLQNYN